MCDNSYVSQCAPSTCESRSAAATSKYGDTALRKTQIGRRTGETLTLIGGDSLIELKKLPHVLVYQKLFHEILGNILFVIGLRSKEAEILPFH